MDRGARFELIRHTDVVGISGTGVIAEGYVSTNGKVVLFWRTEHASVGVYDHIDQMLAIHCHAGTSEVLWLDKEQPTKCLCCGFYWGGACKCMVLPHEGIADSWCTTHDRVYQFPSHRTINQKDGPPLNATQYKEQILTAVKAALDGVALPDDDAAELNQVQEFELIGAVSGAVMKIGLESVGNIMGGMLSNFADQFVDLEVVLDDITTEPHDAPDAHE